MSYKNKHFKLLIWFILVTVSRCQLSDLISIVGHPWTGFTDTGSYLEFILFLHKHLVLCEKKVKCTLV